MNSLILLCLSCAVIGQVVGWGNTYQPQFAVPSKFVVPAAPVAAHKHRFTGSLLLAKAKAYINSDDSTYNSGYGYAAPAYGYAAPSYASASPAYGHATPSYGYAAPAYYGHAAPSHGYAAPAYGHVAPSYGGYAAAPAYGHVAPSYGGYAAAQAYGHAYPNKFYHALQGYKNQPEAPLFAAPFAPVAADSGYLKWNLYNDLNRKNEEFYKFKSEESEKERRQFRKYKEVKEAKEEQFEDFLHHQAEAQEDHQKLQEYRKYSKVNDYLQQREKKAEFGALIGQVAEKRREYVFKMVFRVMQFCKCRDSIVDLHRYFSGEQQDNKYGAGKQNKGQQNAGGDDAQLFGEGGIIPIPRSPEEAKRWFMRGLVNTICDSSKFYVEKVKSLAAQQGFSATFEAQFDKMANGQGQQNQGQGQQNQGQGQQNQGQGQQNQGQGQQNQGQGRNNQQAGNYGNQDNTYQTNNY